MQLQINYFSFRFMFTCLVCLSFVWHYYCESWFVLHLCTQWPLEERTSKDRISSLSILSISIFLSWLHYTIDCQINFIFRLLPFTIGLITWRYIIHMSSKKNHPPTVNYLESRPNNISIRPFPFFMVLEGSEESRPSEVCWSTFFL